jgi:hypothetical protein
MGDARVYGLNGNNITSDEEEVGFPGSDLQTVPEEIQPLAQQNRRLVLTPQGERWRVRPFGFARACPRPFFTLDRKPANLQC